MCTTSPFGVRSLLALRASYWCPWRSLYLSILVPFMPIYGRTSFLPIYGAHWFVCTCCHDDTLRLDNTLSVCPVFLYTFKLFWRTHWCQTECDWRTGGMFNIHKMPFKKCILCISNTENTASKSILIQITCHFSIPAKYKLQNTQKVFQIRISNTCI